MLESQHPNNTFLSWLLPCSCYTRKHTCLAHLYPDILCILNSSPKDSSPFLPITHLHVIFLQFTYCNARFSLNAIQINKPNMPLCLPQFNNKDRLFLSLFPLLQVSAGHPHPSTQRYSCPHAQHQKNSCKQFKIMLLNI